MFKCLFKHDYFCRGVYHYRDTSYGNISGSPSTVATYVCMDCNKPKRRTFYAVGYLSIDQLNAKYSKKIINEKIRENHEKIKESDGS